MRIHFPLVSTLTLLSLPLFCYAEGDTGTYSPPNYGGFGIYAGALMGINDTHWNRIDNLVLQSGYRNLTTTPVGITSVYNKTGFAWNLYAGLNLNQYFALQFDYSNFYQAGIRGWFNTLDNTFVNNYKEYALTGSLITQAPILDTGFNIYAQLGINYLKAGVSGTSPSPNTNAQAWNAAYGAGVKYDFANDLSMKGSWLHFMGNNTVGSSNYLPDVDLFGLGLTYTLSF